MFDIAVSVKYRFCIVRGFLCISLFFSAIPSNIGKWSDNFVQLIL